jgi:ATP-binding cassette subfamily E protein 1
MSKQRIAIVDLEKCKPNKCNKECLKVCPPQRTGKEVIEIRKTAMISESNCIGCGQCVKACPFKAIKVINIPNEIDALPVHRYGENGFRLYRLPVIKSGVVNGIIGENGVGKSTIIKILGNRIKPNFECYGVFAPDKKDLADKEIIKQFKGTELHKYFTNLYSGKLKVCIKTQNLDVPLSLVRTRTPEITVIEYIQAELKTVFTDDVMLKEFELEHIKTNKVLELSGGELQRVLCFITCMSNADVYIFDEPTNYLDVKQRMKMAQHIANLVDPEKYIIVIEHDLAILDYVSDFINVVYGVPGAFGSSSMTYTTANGINYYFDGYLKPENMRIRDYTFDFRETMGDSGEVAVCKRFYEYPKATIEYPKFRLEIVNGKFPMDAGITVILGENGTGKTTFLKYLKDTLGLTVSVKPQYLDVAIFKKKDGKYPTVQELFEATISGSFYNVVFRTDVVKPLNIDELNDKFVDELSGGELQRVWIVYALGQNKQVYLLDEPSANLDVEQRFKINKVIKRFILHNSKTAFVVEHDMTMATSLAQELNSRVIVMHPQKELIDDKRVAYVGEPCDFTVGINDFLKRMAITFRTESYSKHNRPRINKMNSSKDKEQKAENEYYK